MITFIIKQNRLLHYFFLGYPFWKFDLKFNLIGFCLFNSILIGFYSVTLHITLRMPERFLIKMFLKIPSTADKLMKREAFCASPSLGLNIFIGRLIILLIGNQNRRTSLRHKTSYFGMSPAWLIIVTWLHHPVEQP